MTHTTSANSAEALLGRIAGEFTDRLRNGEQPDVEEYAQRHPEMAEVLRQVLPALQLLAPVGSAEGMSGSLGDFRILREVGRGGMGIVYEAEQTSLGRRVALKVLPFAATMDPRQLQRFHNEARAAASLQHPHIVPVYAVGCERGVPFYAMQFIDGRTLAELVAQLRQQAQAVSPELAPCDAAYWRRVAGWGVQAAEALEHAHSLGIVHRDVKPGNLLIDDLGKLWVTDFGLARTAGGSGLTFTGDLVGTLRYMSPEQALARHGLVNHLSDVYALGATLYELLTLRPAVGGADHQEFLQRIAFEEPEPPRAVNRGIPADLETIVLKAIVKEPERRFATARDFADDLRRFLDDKPIQARRPHLGARLARWGRRHQGVVWSGGLGLLFAVVTLASSSLVLWREKEQVKRALAEKDAQHRRAERQYRRAEFNFIRMIRTTTEVLDVAGRLNQSGAGGQQALDECVDRVLQQFLDKAGKDPDALRDAAWNYENFGGYYFNKHQFAKAEQKYRIALAQYESLLAESPEAPAILYPLSRCREYFGFLLHATGQIDEARQQYARALASLRLRMRLTPDWRVHADLAKFLVNCPMREFRDPEEALRLARRAVELPKGNVSYAEACCWEALGLVHYRNGNWQQAIASLEEAVRHSGDDGISTFVNAMAHHRVGQTNRARGEYLRGIEWMAVKIPYYHNRSGPPICLIRDEAAALLGIQERPPPPGE